MVCFTPLPQYFLDYKHRLLTEIFPFTKVQNIRVCWQSTGHKLYFSSALFNRRHEAAKSCYLHQIFEVGLMYQGPWAAGSQNVGQRAHYLCVCRVWGVSVLWSTLLSVHLSLHTPTPNLGLPFPHLSLKDYCLALVSV